MNHNEQKRTIEHHTDTPISWGHISLLNGLFKDLNLNLKLETEDETPYNDLGTIKPHGQIIRLLAGKFEKVNGEENRNI